MTSHSANVPHTDNQQEIAEALVAEKHTSQREAAHGSCGQTTKANVISEELTPLAKPKREPTYETKVGPKRNKMFKANSKEHNHKYIITQPTKEIYTTQILEQKPGTRRDEKNPIVSTRSRSNDTNSSSSDNPSVAFTHGCN